MRFRLLAALGVSVSLLAVAVHGTTSVPAAPVVAARAGNDSDCFYDLAFSHAARPAPKRHARRIFARRNIWNTPVPRSARLDPDSRLMAAQLTAEVRDQFRRGVGPWLDRGSYSTPLYRVGRHQPLRRVALDFSTNACRLSLGRAFARVPLPDSARPASGDDHHLTLWQPSTDKLWEFWHLRREPDGWHAGFGGAIRGVSHSPGRFDADSWPGVHKDWGATASGLPVIGGVITPRELARHRIPHALALNLPNIRKGLASFPALKSDGTSVGRAYLPEGARLRLDPRLDLEALHLSPLVLSLARAAQRYGLYVRDRTRAGATFFAQDVSQSDPNAYRGARDPLGGKLPHKVLIGFPWAHLQVLRLRPRFPARYTYPRRVIAPDGSPAR